MYPATIGQLLMASYQLGFGRVFIIVEEANGVDSPAGTSGFFEMGVDISEFSYSCRFVHYL
jgi:hypothetical protein